MKSNLIYSFSFFWSWQFWLSLFIFAVVLLLFYPFKVRGLAYINLLLLTGMAGIYIFNNLNVFAAKIEASENGIILIDKKNKEKRIFLNSKMLKSSEPLNGVIAALLNKQINACFYGGVKEDAFKTALLCGSFITATEAVAQILENKFKTKLQTSVVNSNSEDVLSAAIEITANIVLIKVITALIFSLIKGVRKNGKQK